MKLFPLALLATGLAVSLAVAQTQAPQPAPDATREHTYFGGGFSGVIRPEDVNRYLEGEAFFLERIALPPGAMLHVSLVGRVAGAEYLPLATTIVPAKNGTTPFRLEMLNMGLPPGPYRLQAWIVADNRLYMQGHDAQTAYESFDKAPKIRLKIVSAPQNIDGIGDGKPLPLAPRKMILKGTVSKLDRRALHPDSRIEIKITDLMTPNPKAMVVFGHIIQLEGGQLPKDFQLQLAPGDLQAKRAYGLSAQVFEVGKVTYSSNTFIAVSPDDLAKNFDIRVVPAP